MKKILPMVFIVCLSFLYLSCDGVISEIPAPSHTPGYCLTFDDNYVNQWGSIKTLLDSNDVHVTFFITDVSKFSSSELSTIHSLQDFGNEIGCHSLNHLNPVEYLTNHSVKQYIDAEIIPALDNFHKINIYPTAFAFPYGLTTDSLNAALVNYFKILRTVAEEQRNGRVDSVETIESVFYKFDNSKIVAGLGIDENFNIDMEKIKRAFARAKARNEIVVFYAHCPVDKITSTYQTEKSFLRQLFKLAKTMNLRSYRFSELIN